MRLKYGLILGLTLALSLCLAVAQRQTIRVFQSLSSFNEVVGQGVTIIDFERLPVGSLGQDTYRDRGVIFRTDQPLQAHRTSLAPSLSVEEHIGATRNKILVSDAIPMVPHALTVQFPPGTLAAGCFLIAAAGEGGATVQVEAYATDGSRQRVEVRAFADSSSDEPRRGRRRTSSEATFIGFLVPQGLQKMTFWAEPARQGPVHNFGLDDIMLFHP